MTDPSGKSLPDARFRLRTFGTFGLVGPGDETILGSHGHQHRRLALLAVLAAAGANGRSRDHLLLLFWPDATQARARHSLEQLLYSLRSAVDEKVFAGVNPVRLNPEVLTSDVANFKDALGRADFEAAIKEYGGPFLDGFYLSDSPEFEQWLSEERARLARAHTDALERLAHNAESKNEYREAVSWWEKLAEADPVSSKSATGLMRALMKSGDNAAALRYAERYEAIVSRELGTSAGPAIANLVAQARAASKSAVVPTVGSAIADRPPGSSAKPVGEHAHLEPIAGVSEIRTPSRRSERARLILVAVALVLVVAVAAAWLRTRPGVSESSANSRPSIAVLPLANVGRAAEDVAFVDGLSEELMAALARIDNLRVIARTSAFVFQNSNLGAREIADSLGVSHVLEGSVQKSGSRLRVQVRLVDAEDGSTRWSETFNRELVDVFGVQSEIASAVARQLDLRLRRDAATELKKGSTRNIAAYELYLRGRDLTPMRFAADSGKLRALDYLKQAVALDPDFAAAYAHMPYWYVALATNADRDSVASLRRLADSTARLALRLDPLLAESHIGSALAQILGSGNLSGAESALRRALEIGGGTRAREHLARVLLWSGRREEALAENLRAAQDDPLSASAAADAGRTLCFSGRHAEGFAYLARVAKVRPPLQRVSKYIAFCHGLKGEWKTALAQTLQGSGPRGRDWTGYFYARAGDTSNARRIQSDLIERWRQTGRGAASIAIVAAGLGETDAAFEWLDRTDHEPFADVGELSSPLLDGLHRDPRWNETARRLGLQSR